MAKGPGGRPTKYTEELVSKAKEYVKTYKDLGDVIPSIEGLSIYLEIARSTLYEWEKEKPEFSYILRHINVVQKQVLLNQGLAGNFNSNIVKLVLGKHGFSEKSSQEISGPGGKPVENKWEVTFVSAKEEKDKS